MFVPANSFSGRIEDILKISVEFALWAKLYSYTIWLQLGLGTIPHLCIWFPHSHILLKYGLRLIISSKVGCDSMVCW